MIHQGLDIQELCKESIKIETLKQGLIRKGLITDNLELTVNGTELLIFLTTKEKTKFVKKKVENNDFNRWWEIYPTTNKFDYKGISFKGSRGLRINEDDCRIKFDKIILEGKFTAEQIIKATQYDIFQKKEESFRKKDNKLTYLQNSVTYLNQKSFEPFIELYKEETKEEEELFNGTEI